MLEYLDHPDCNYYGEDREHKKVDNGLSTSLRWTERRRKLGRYEELNRKQGQVDIESPLIQQTQDEDRCEEQKGVRENESVTVLRPTSTPRFLVHLLSFRRTCIFLLWTSRDASVMDT